MKKFKVEVSQPAYRLGFYEIEAPDEDAAYVLAADIKNSDPRIVWEEFRSLDNTYPDPDRLFVKDAE